MKSDMNEGERGGGASFIKAAVHQSEDRCGQMWSRVSAELTLCWDVTGARRPLQTRIRPAVTEDADERTNDFKLRSAAELRSLTGDKCPEI